jgi:hypothetical protein
MAGKQIFIKILIPFLLFLVCFPILIYTSYPSIGWWDSGGEAVNAFRLSIPGASGSILYILLGRFFTILFFFVSPIRAITLVSIFSTSLAALFFYFTLKLILNRLDPSIENWVKMSTALVTAVSLPFLFSIWSESHVCRVYSLGLLITSILAFISVKIWLTEDEYLKMRLFLIGIYFLGLDFAAHRLNQPFVVFFLLALFLQKHKWLFKYQFWLITLSVYLLSLTVHFYLLARSPLNPPLYMEEVKSFGQLISWIRMERYGESNFKILFSRRAPFWDYQLKFMYLRYFAWNFFGTNGKGLIPLLNYILFFLGSIGFFLSFFKSKKIWIYLFILFSIFSFILAFYFNVSDGFHHIREIDRLYLPSFLIFLIWVGIGLYFSIAYILKILPGTSFVRKISFTLLIIIAVLFLPVNLIFSNWQKCNKQNYYFPEDFAMNLLSSCEKNGVLFTNGDNDTYPLWYLQHVKGYRQDVIVANIPLLNINFFQEQLSKLDNSFLPDANLLKLPAITTILLPDSLKIKIPPPLIPVNKFQGYDTLEIKFEGHPLNDQKLLLIQDQVILSFLKKNMWGRPVYFASTVNARNRVGLEDYLGFTGIVSKLIPEKRIEIIPQELEKNLTKTYQFRFLNDPKVYLNSSQSAIYNNYRYAFIRLADYYLEQGNYDKVIKIFSEMKDKLPDWRFSEHQNKIVVDFEKKLNKYIK